MKCEHSAGCHCEAIFALTDDNVLKAYMLSAVIAGFLDMQVQNSTDRVQLKLFSNCFLKCTK